MRIDDGRRAGGAMVTFTSKDVARARRVSQSTVSYVMTGKRPISERTRQRVLAAIEQLTYEPNAGRPGSGQPAHPGRRSGRALRIAARTPLGLLPFIETIASSARERRPRGPARHGGRGLRRPAAAGRTVALRRDRDDGHPGRRTTASRWPPRCPFRWCSSACRPTRRGCTASTSTSRRRRGWPSTSWPTTGHDEVVVVGYPAGDGRSRPQLRRPLPRSARRQAECAGLPHDGDRAVEPGRGGRGRAVDRASPGATAGVSAWSCRASRSCQPC